VVVPVSSVLFYPFPLASEDTNRAQPAAPAYMVSTGSQAHKTV
jgi:hypothetical protein